MAGSKAQNLIKLKGTFGEKVPDFLVLHDTDFIEGKYDERKREEILEKIKQAAKPDWELSAVRSSSSLEDGNASSFAGQFDTYLNVRENELAEKILECFLSVNNENVRDYMESRKNDDENVSISMDVIVQKMVDADAAGVMFATNPQGLLNETVIVADEGLGENVVGGKTNPTSYYYNTTDKVYYYDGDKDILSREEIEELINISEKISKELLIKYPDVEFAVKDKKIYILQARPITTIDDSHTLIFDNTNIVESYPGVSLPLTCSFVNLVYGGVFKDVCGRVLKNKKLLAKQEDIFYNMVGDANGRLYYKITNWYAILLVLPLNKKIIPIWQEMMGVKDKNYDKKLVKLNPFERLMTYVNTVTEFLRVPKNMEKLEKEFQSIKAYYDETFNENLSNEELFEIFDTLQDRLFSCWGVTLLNDLYAFVFTGLLKSRLTGKYKVEGEELNRYIAGISNIESLKPIKAMIDLSFDKKDLSDKEYRQRFDEYIELYGDRNLEELKLESRTFRSTPSLLEEKINGFTKDAEALKEMHEKIHAGDSKENLKWNDSITKFLMKRCNKGIANREISRLNRSRVYGFVRSITEAAGKNFVKEGKLDDYTDVFYLTLDELRNGDGDLKSLVSERKNDYETYRLIPTYSKLIFTEKEFDKKQRSVNSHAVKINEGRINGTPCSAGKIKAEALVVEDVTKVRDVKGKILITKMTDPGWVFLLATAAGVISEKGSLLSHTAIISRELKIPSIVGVEDVMNKIETGDVITMDGSTGIIEIEKRG